MEDTALKSTSTVAIIGGGISGVATAAALVNGARARGRAIEVIVYESARAEGAAAPVILSAECRSRLAALGCRAPPEWRALALERIEVISESSSATFELPMNALWVIDDYDGSGAGTHLLRRALTAASSLQGARVVARTVQQVDWAPPTEKGDPPLGFLAVRAQGRVDRVSAAILATGAGGPLSAGFAPTIKPAPSMPAVHARLRYAVGFGSRNAVLKLVLHPLPGMDGLYLIPCGRSIHVVGFGPRINQTDLCQALMNAARDGHLRDGFELSGIRVGRIPYGAGHRLVAPRRLVVGPAVCGHPLQLCISETLAIATRAAAAMLDVGADEVLLHDRFVRDGVLDLLDDSLTVARAMGWLRRAKGHASSAIARARRHQVEYSPYSASVLGMASPGPRGLLRAARWEGLKQVSRGIFVSSPEPHRTALPPEPNLIFVVDDDDEVREGLTAYLEQRGAKVVAFSDELSLFAAVAQRPPSAILVDVVLSWVDGLRLCEGLKQHPSTRGARVIVTSGLDLPHIRARAIDAGAEAFLPKPIDPRLLWAMLTHRSNDEGTIEARAGS